MLKIDANLADALCRARAFVFGLPTGRYDAVDMFENSRFEFAPGHRIDIQWDRWGDHGTIIHGGLEHAPRNLLAAPDFAAFMHLVDTMVLNAAPQTTYEQLALCNAIALNIDGKVLDRIITSHHTREAKLALLAEQHPSIPAAIERATAPHGTPAQLSLVNWAERVDAWMLSEVEKEVLDQGEFTFERIYSNVGLDAAAFRAGTSSLAVGPARTPTFSERLLNFVSREKRHNNGLTEDYDFFRVTSYEGDDAGVARVSRDGSEVALFGSLTPSRSSEIMDALNVAITQRHAAPNPRF